MVVATIVLDRGQRAQGPATARRPRRAADATAAGAHSARTRRRPSSPARASPKRASAAAASSVGSSGGASPAGSPTSSGRPPIVVATTGHARGHRLHRGERHDLRAARRHDRERRAGPQRRHLVRRDLADEADAVAGARAHRVRVGAVAGDDERQARALRTPRPRRRRPSRRDSRAATSACSPAAAAERSANVRCTCGTTWTGTPSIGAPQRPEARRRRTRSGRRARRPARRGAAATPRARPRRRPPPSALPRQASRTPGRVSRPVAADAVVARGR